MLRSSWGNRHGRCVFVSFSLLRRGRAIHREHRRADSVESPDPKSIRITTHPVPAAGAIAEELGGRPRAAPGGTPEAYERLLVASTT